jgi:hypothetical protein
MVVTSTGSRSFDCASLARISAAFSSSPSAGRANDSPAAIEIGSDAHSGGETMKSAGSGVKVRTGVKSGGMSYQHNRPLKVRVGVKAGGMTYQHSRRGLKVRTSVKASGMQVQHSRRVLNVRAGVKAGGMSIQHNRPLKVRTRVKAGGLNLQHNRRALKVRIADEDEGRWSVGPAQSATASSEVSPRMSESERAPSLN